MYKAKKVAAVALLMTAIQTYTNVASAEDAHIEAQAKYLMELSQKASDEASRMADASAEAHCRAHPQAQPCKPYAGTEEDVQRAAQLINHMQGISDEAYRVATEVAKQSR